jgi:hypothetical protein
MRRLQTTLMWHAVRGLFAVLLCLVVVPWTGCALGPDRGLRDDIVAIRQYVPNPGWLKDPADERVAGIATRVYFRSAETEKGTFVKGPFEVDLMLLSRGADGRYKRAVVHTWQFREPGVMGLRSRKAAVLGDSYLLPLHWPEDMDLAGQEIQLLYRYHRADGHVIERTGSKFRVPVPLAYLPRQGATAPTGVDRKPDRTSDSVRLRRPAEK